MMDMKVIGQGRCATVYEYGDDKVLKLFHPSMPENFIAQEYSISNALNGLNIRAPRCFGLIDHEKRKGIVYERVEGKSLLGMMFASPLRITRYARKLADMHHELHGTGGEGLPHGAERFRRMISYSKESLGDLYEPLCAYLDTLMDGTSEPRVCHGDFHPDNVMAGRKGAMIIDWSNAYNGDPCSDVARSYVMFSSPMKFEGQSLPVRVYIRIVRYILGIAYMRRYRKISGVARSDIEKWYPVIAGARLCENVPGEREWLLEMVGRYVRERR